MASIGFASYSTSILRSPFCSGSTVFTSGMGGWAGMSLKYFSTSSITSGGFMSPTTTTTEVLGEIVFGLFLGNILYVRHPAYDGPAVGVCGEGGCVQLLEHETERTGLGAHPPLFHYHVFFRIELTEYQVLHPVRFDKGPQLQLVGGSVAVVPSNIIARGGVYPRGPVLHVDGPKLFGVGYFLLLLSYVLQLRLKGLAAVFIGCF